MRRVIKGFYGVLLVAGISQLSSCTKKTEDNFDASTECFKCHTGTTELGKKVLWAKEGWQESVHAKGFLVDLAYEDKDGKYVKIGEEWEGTDSFYANGGGCQICHTSEGFLKNINGEYADADAIAADYIDRPGPIGCFSCHKPHDTKDFSLTVADGTEVTLQSGTVYNKPEGSLCAECHMMRVGTTPKTANELILAAVQNTKTGGIQSQRTAVHHGPQTDMLMGTLGATYTGKTYSNSTHTTLDDANCITCHFAFAPDASLKKTAGLSPKVGGHSFDIISTVHGGQVANATGCLSCHAKAAAKTVAAADAKGYLTVGFAYVDNGDGMEHIKAMNTTLTALADPDNSCNGLLQKALVKLNGDDATKGFTWSEDGKCVLEGVKGKVAGDATATDTSPITRVYKGIFNWGYAYFEDRSFGHHNAKLALQLLNDTCEDLKDYIGDTTTDCGTRP